MERSGTGTVIEPLLTLEREEMSGVLEFRAQGVDTRIYLRAGEIVFADAGTVGETLGRILIRSARLTEEQVAAVIRRMTEAIVENEHVRFGEVVVEYGFLTADELAIALTQQVKEKIMGCIHRGSGDWTFAKDDPRVEEVGRYVVRTRPTLVEAAAYLPERRLETVLHLDENRYPEVVAPEAVVAEEFALSDAEAALLKELDGTASLHFIFSTATSVNVAPLVAALVLGGGVELRTTPAKARNPSENRATPLDFRRARKTHDTTPAPAPQPETRHEAPSVEVQARGREALARLNTDLDARQPLSGRKRWPEPKDDKERRLLAESAFHHGRMHLRAEEAERALPGLYRAFELRPEEREYELYVKWARMRVDDCFEDDARRAEVQSLATTLVHENRDCELALAVLGHCALHDGKEEAALRFFQRAADLDPNLVEAGRLARLLASRSASTAKRPSASKPDARARRMARGLLVTPIDEIVPMLVRKRSDGSEKDSAKEEALAKARAASRKVGKATPHGGLRVTASERSADETWEATPAPPPTYEALEMPPTAMVASPSLSAPPTPSSSPPPPSADPRPPPTVNTPGLAPQLPVGASSTSGGVASSQPLAALPSVRPPTIASPSVSIKDEVPASGPRHGRAIAIAFTWIASLSVTAVVFYFVGARATVAPSISASSARSSSLSATAAATHSSDPSPAPPVDVVGATASAPSAVSVPTTSSSSVPNESAPDVAPATTGILRILRGHGRRVYVDGHIVGEGGHNLTVRCGTHRVKVGSSGVERSVAIPCGGTVELE